MGRQAVLVPLRGIVAMRDEASSHSQRVDEITTLPGSNERGASEPGRAAPYTLRSLMPVCSAAGQWRR
ncbi:MAG: hypothetical protein WBX25_19010 [Rhodomicrobium sp.]